LKTKVDRELCVGLGNCVAIAPTVFKLDGDNKAVILDAKSVDDKKLWQAAESCPVQAITLEDETGRVIYP
jgi:ferredoxin